MSYEQVALNDVLNGNLIFRNLRPVNPELPDYKKLASSLDLNPRNIPRKTSPQYALVVSRIFKAIERLNGGRQKFSNLVYVGDTIFSDGLCFKHLCETTRWHGKAFIGEDDFSCPANIDERYHADATITVANRWTEVYTFAAKLQKEGWVTPETVVVCDIDKTLLAARGRNGHLIDQVRLSAALEIGRNACGDYFNEKRFTDLYHNLDQAAYHPLTDDNQDYLVYICLMLNKPWQKKTHLKNDILDGRLRSFHEFIDWMQDHLTEMPLCLHGIHQSYFQAYMDGDLTPFKSFRQSELRHTLSLMGHLADDASFNELLKNEIVITEEVFSVLQQWQKLGAFIISLSDKPDEAAIPTRQMEIEGVLPLHLQKTHCVGNLQQNLVEEKPNLLW